MGLNATIQISFSARYTGSADYGPQEFDPEIKDVLSIINGTSAGQSDKLFVDERAVNASSNDDIDLAGVLVDAFGAVVTFVTLTGILLINKPRLSAAAVNVSNLTVGAATNPFLGFVGGTTPTIGPIRPGGRLLLDCAGTGGIGAVVAATGDILRIANGAGGVATYQIALWGRSA